MQHITLTISNLALFNSIKNKIQNNTYLSEDEQIHLVGFLSQIPTSTSELLKHLDSTDTIEVKLWNVENVEISLTKWRALFLNIPGFEYAPDIEIIDRHCDRRLYYKNIIMVAIFSPTLSHNAFEGKSAYEVHLKDDGTATFWFPTFEDAEQYPELFNFKGSWKDAYLLLIETLKRGWPMEDFPLELQQFLKK